MPTPKGPTTAEYMKDYYPLPVYNYLVDFSDADGTTSIGFSEISGLDIVYETTTYKESRTGGNKPGPNVMLMPMQGTPTSLTLKKGLIKRVSVPKLYDWINSIQLNQVDKKDITIKLCDEKNEPVVVWKVGNAFPTRLEIPTFDASSNEVAVDTLELMADTLSVEEAK